MRKYLFTIGTLIVSITLIAGCGSKDGKGKESSRITAVKDGSVKNACSDATLNDMRDISDGYENLEAKYKQAQKDNPNGIDPNARERLRQEGLGYVAESRVKLDAHKNEDGCVYNLDDKKENLDIRQAQGKLNAIENELNQ